MRRRWHGGSPRGHGGHCSCVAELSVVTGAAALAWQMRHLELQPEPKAVVILPFRQARSSAAVDTMSGASLCLKSKTQHGCVLQRKAATLGADLMLWEVLLTTAAFCHSAGAGRRRSGRWGCRQHTPAGERLRQHLCHTAQGTRAPAAQPGG